MDFSFLPALEKLGLGFAARLINAARPAANYLFASFLPERAMPSYEVKDASLTVRSAMAGLVGMDSPFPPTGVMEAASFLERSAKIANRVTLSEEALRQLQQLMMHLQISGMPTNERMVEEVLNFTNGVIIQPHLDTAEWLRAQALCTGAIDWTFGPIKLAVDYGIPAGNKLTARTGNDAYSGSASKFWTDTRDQGRKLRAASGIVRLMHPDLVEDVVANAANTIRVVSEDASQIVLQRMIAQNGTNTPSSDARDSVTILKYGLEAEVIDPADPTKTKVIPFMPKTAYVAIGTAVNTGYVVGAGSRQPTPYELGYTHVAPTVEGAGVPGRWSRVFVPQDRPYQLQGEGVANLLPVINANSVNRIVIAKSDLSS
jgi:hypothetical protein